MHLLLTRAEEDAARTRAKLEAAGHRVMVSPVIEIVPTPAQWPDGVVDAVVATSGQAFVSLAVQTHPLPEARRLLPLFLVGERTAERARERGFMGATTVTPNVATLAIELGKSVRPPKNFVYLAGRDRKPDVETALETIGARFETLEIYEARAATGLEPAAVAGLRGGTIKTVLHFSHRSADLFRQMAMSAEVDTPSLTHLCLSEDVASPLRSANCDKIEVAEEPNEAALLALVDRL